MQVFRSGWDGLIVRVIACAALALSPGLGGVAVAAEGIMAGAAAVDVTPQAFPLNMPGGFSANLAERAHDPLHARALCLASADTSLAIVVVDSLGVAPELIAEAKAAAAALTGLPVERMLVCSTHTHSGPPSNTREGPAPAVAYRQRLLDGIRDAIVQAHERLAPAAVGVAVHPLPDEVFNRRWFLKPGRMPPNPFGTFDEVKMNPGTSPEVLDRPAGPTDPDVTILSVQDRRRRPLAIVANYALHYVGGGPRGQISADYFGEFARLMPSRLRADDGFVAMMSNGASGDVNNIPFIVGRPPREPFEQIRVVATKAADAAWLAHRSIERHLDAVPLGMAERTVELRYRRPTEAQVEAARNVLAVKDPDAIAALPKLAQNYARNVIRAHEREEDTLTVILQAIRVGDAAICGIPFETFAEIGLELKDRSPFRPTMVIGLANGRHGYLPTPRQHRWGGYETWIGTNQVQEDASEILVGHLLEMLTELRE